MVCITLGGQCDVWLLSMIYTCVPAVSTGPSSMSKEEVYKYRLMEKFAGVWKSRVKKGR